MLTETPNRMPPMPTPPEPHATALAEVPSRLEYPWGDALPDSGSAIEVAPGIYWLRMGLPFALNHINLWLLRDRLPHPSQIGVMQEGWTAVDCGIDNPSTREAWQHIDQNVLQGLPILRVLVTHMHPDHMGMAHHLCARWQAPLWMSTSEYQSAAIASAGLSNFGGAATVAFFAAHGWRNPDELAVVQSRVGYYKSMVPAVPPTYVRLMDGASVTIGERRWQCLSGFGHSPEHMALHSAQDDVLISGDMLLPSISTNISVYATEPESNPLQLFLDSLSAMSHLTHETLVLPSHGRPFKGAPTRLQQLRAHHDDRLSELLACCRQQAISAHEALPTLFKRALDVHQTTFAMGEAVAHLHALWQSGQVDRRLGDDGIYRFGAAQS